MFQNGHRRLTLEAIFVRWNDLFIPHHWLTGTNCHLSQQKFPFSWNIDGSERKDNKSFLSRRGNGLSNNQFSLPLISSFYHISSTTQIAKLIWNKIRTVVVPKSFIFFSFLWWTIVALRRILADNLWYFRFSRFQDGEQGWQQGAGSGMTELRRRLVLPIVPSPPPIPAYLTMVSQLSNVFCKIQIIFVRFAQMQLR